MNKASFKHAQSWQLSYVRVKLIPFRKTVWAEGCTKAHRSCTYLPDYCTYLPDLALICPIKLQDDLNQDLVNLQNWLHGNKLSLNVVKTQSLIIGSRLPDQIFRKSKSRLKLSLVSK